MQASIKDLPVIVDSPTVTIRAIKWGDMMVEVGDTHQKGETSAANFKGLPDDRCQCPHWGYVIKGQMRFKYADSEEVYSEGDLFFMPPGHVPSSSVGCQWLDFSPSDEYTQTMEVIIRNAKSRQ